jgi:hypothetical protein
VQDHDIFPRVSEFHAVLRGCGRLHARTPLYGVELETMREESAMLSHIDSPCRRLAPRSFAAGTPVVICAGPLQGVRGTILSLAADDWPIVMLRLVRGTTALELPPWWIHVDDGFTEIAQPRSH